MSLASDLHEAVAAVCPIEGVRLGDRVDRATWKIDFAPRATKEQRAAAQQALRDFVQTQRRAVLARDVVSAFSPEDYAAIKAATAQSAPLAYWWDLLLVRGEKPIDTDGDTFAQAWGALEGVLGTDRAAALLAGLRARAANT